VPGPLFASIVFGGIVRMRHAAVEVKYPNAAFRHIDTLLLKAEQLAAWVGILGLASIMVLVSADALGRYFLDAPLQFQYELTSYYLMGLTSVVALSWGVRRGAHIRIAVIDQLVSHRLRGVLFGVNYLLSAAVMAIVAVYAGEEAWRTWKGAEVFFGVIDWPAWLARIWVPIGCALLALRLSLDAIMVLVDPAHAEVLGSTTDRDSDAEVDAV